MGRRIWEERLDAAGVQKGWNYVYYNQNGEVEWTDGPRYAPEDFTYARYDGMGRVVEEVMWRSRAKADGTGVEEVPGADLYATVKKTYNLFGDLIKTMDPRGNTTRLFYDATGRPTESRAYEGDWENGGAMLAKSSTTYNSELDGLGIPRDRSVTATAPNGGVTTTWHTQAGKPWKQENPDGTVLGWEYYLDGRTKKEPVSPSTYVLYEYQDATRQVTKTLKNYAGNILGQPQVTTANCRGQVVSVTDAAGNIVTSTYDQVGRPLEAFQPKAAGDPNPALLASRQIYDAAGVVAIAENALGQRTVTEHDTLGRPVRTQVREADQTVVQESSIVYLAGQHGVTTTSGVANTATAISSTAYTDNAGNTVLAINPGGSFSRTEYDVGGNAVAVHTAADLNGVAGFETTTTTTSYDGANRPRTTMLPDGAQVTMHYAYVTQGSGIVVSPSPTDVILGTVVEKRMPSPAASSALAPVQGGFIEYQRLDSAGRLITKSIKAGDGTSTREQTNYVYFPANAGKDAGLLQSYQQQVTTSGFRSHVYVYDEWRRVQTYTCGTSGQDDHVVRTFTYNDPRSLVTDLREDTRDGYTIVHRDYDAQTRVTSETVSMDGAVIRHLTNGYDAAGRRSTLEKGSSIADLGTGAGGSFAFGWQADGALKSVTADGKVFEYSYANNGLVIGRSNPWRSYVVNQRDNRGRLTQATTSVVGLPGTLLQETLTWLDDNRQSSYVATRAALPGGPAAQTDARYYGYDVERRRLVSESYTPVTGVAQNLSFQYDFGFAGLGIRTSATQGSSPTADFRSYVAPGDTGATSKFARVLRQKNNEKVHDITATGNAFGAASVTASIEKVGSLPNVSHPGWQHPVGNWSVPLRLWPGDHSLEAIAHHPGGTFNTSATSNFSLARLEEQVSNTYDEEGNVIQRSWSLSGRTQVLTWDGQGRLLAVTDRDAVQQGINWQARYDGLGRRLRTVTQTVRFGGVVGDSVQEDSWYDPLHEFLEVAVETKVGGVDVKRTWKVHGPDANGGYGGLQGIGGFEATVDEVAGTWTAVVDDYYGHAVATVDGGATATVTWQVTRCASYGPQPGSPVLTLAHGVSVAQSTNWRGERMDVTGFYYLGARYYEPVDGKFISPDPLGHGASMGLYEFSGSDPVNFVDPSGRMQKPQSSYVDNGYRFYDDPGTNVLAATIKRIKASMAGPGASSAEIAGMLAAQEFEQGNAEWNRLLREPVNGYVAFENSVMQYLGIPLASMMIAPVLALEENYHFSASLTDDGQKSWGHALNMTFNPALLITTHFREVWDGSGYSAANIGRDLDGLERMGSGFMLATDVFAVATTAGPVARGVVSTAGKGFSAVKMFSNRFADMSFLDGSSLLSAVDAADALPRMLLNNSQGTLGEAAVRSRLLNNARLELVGEQIRITTPGVGNYRVTDFLVRMRKTGKLAVIEVKTGDATRDAIQLAKDALIADPLVPTAFTGRRARMAGFPRGTPTGPIKTYEINATNLNR